MEKKVLKAMKKAGKPVRPGEVATMIGEESKAVSKIISSLKKKGKVIGRIAAFIDTLANEFWKEEIGLFGYYECIPDDAASTLLLEAANIWLREHHCTSMRGPWSFVPQEFGMVVEGFKPSPVIMAPYNPPYYKEHLEGCFPLVL